jgi:Schlafen, AlbA_2
VEDNRQWTEPRLVALIGQTESIRREFKSGRMFDVEPESKWIDAISKEVSALANTEGGELFLGIDEDRKTRPRPAKVLDGVPANLPSDRLQQLIEGNLYPYLPGIRIQRVPLTQASGRVVFVISIPQGSTAYQAKDGRYYGRSEFEAKFLPDHEVRLRMSRGKVARGIVSARLLKVEFGIEKAKAAEREYRETERRLTPKSREDQTTKREILFSLLDAMSLQNSPDMIRLDFTFRNDGDITIRTPVIEFREEHSEGAFADGKVKAQALPQRVIMDGETIYPGDLRTIDRSERWLTCQRDMSFSAGDYLVRWQVFLDNSPPSSGEIDLGMLIQPARIGAADQG